LQSSFGFGQVGGTALILHPRHLFGALEPTAYESYKSLNRTRALQSYKAMSEMMITNSLVKIKDAPPYGPDLEGPVLLNSLARATLDSRTGSYVFRENLENRVKSDLGNAKAVKDIIAHGAHDVAGVGVDQGSRSPYSMDKNPLADPFSV
jgi:fatty acid synthase subunit alpha, fungi type